MSYLPLHEEKPLILSVQNLCVTAPQIFKKDGENLSEHILKHVSFHMHSGDRIAIIGTSGSGKTTLLQAIAGALPHSLNISGSVCMQEDNSAYIMQEPKAALNPIRTIKNMFLALRHRKRGHIHTAAKIKKNRHYRKQQILKNMHSAFETLNLLNSSAHDIRDDTRDLQKLLAKRRSHISGGMAQRIMVALTVTAGSQWALADEVSSALDEVHERKTIEMLLKTMKSVLFVTHRMRIVKSYCNKVLVLQDGAVHFFGTTRELLSSQDNTQFIATLMCESPANGEKSQSTYKKSPRLTSISTPTHPQCTKAILCCEGISARYGGTSLYNSMLHNAHANTIVFQDLNFAAQAGEVVCIRGETGCGKSTFAHICSGYIRPSSGIVRMHNKPMPYGLSRAMRIFRRDVQLISQVPSLSFNPMRTVLHSIMDAYSTTSRKEKKRSAEYLCYLSEKMHISYKLLTRFPQQLSGGQLQRISMIRALLPCPKILILDEPVSHLDPHIRVYILEILCAIHAETGITLIMISHLEDIHNFIKSAYPHFTDYKLEQGILFEQ